MLNKSGEYVIFTHDGNTMIGKLFPSKPENGDIYGEELEDGTRQGSIQFIMITKPDDYYWIANPAKIDFKLDIPASGDADLKWSITPVFFPDLISVQDTLFDTIYVTYPKSTVALTNIGGSVINSTILDAYKELCE